MGVRKCDGARFVIVAAGLRHHQIAVLPHRAARDERLRQAIDVESSVGGDQHVGVVAGVRLRRRGDHEHVDVFRRLQSGVVEKSLRVAVNAHLVRLLEES